MSNPPRVSERDLIRWIRSQCQPDTSVQIGIGDDAAVIRSVDGALLVTTDMLLEGVHFELSQCSPGDVGRKAMNVNLSDIAAMAGQPTAAVVSIGLPPGRRPSLAQELFAGLAEAASHFNVSIIGGDTNASKSDLVISVTVLGKPTGSGPVLRSGARPGDALCVTGELGYSLLGRHLSFTPRVIEAQRLHQSYSIHAMIDLSDGLAVDLFHIAEESGCGALVKAAAVPISSARRANDDRRSPLDHALNDGEDFELLFTLAEPDAQRLIVEQPLRDLCIPVARIGSMTNEPGVRIQLDEATIAPLQRLGFTHSWQ